MLILSILLFQVIQSTEVINPSEIEVGMTGYGLTTFQGIEIDTFDVIIKGKLPPSATGPEIIIAELKGGVLEESGVLSGMSGSPVYINGKILGAVAYSWPFSRRPICGIMPFREMIEDNTARGRQTGDMNIIKPVLSASGFPSSCLGMLDSLPGSFVVSTGQLSGEASQSTPLTPGGVCGVSLVTGDGNISMMGTITEVRGDTIYAFGHPAYSTGLSELPLCSGMVSSYLPSIYHSFKFANPGEIMGTITSDNYSGVRGIVGKEPPMINCGIKINDSKSNYRITKMENLLPNLLSFLVYSNLVKVIGSFEQTTLKGNINLFTDEGNITVRPVMSGKYLQQNLYSWVVSFLIDIQDNMFKKISIDSIKTYLETTGKIEEFVVREIKADKREFNPGETIEISVVLNKYRESDTTLSFSIQAPQNPCDIFIHTSGAFEHLEFERNRMPENFRFETFKEWKNFINDMPTRDQLIISLYKRGYSISTGEGELKNPPLTLQGIMRKSENMVSNNVFPLKTIYTTMMGPVRGESSLMLEIRR